MPLTPETRLGHYEVRGALGAGGMGEVYRAYDTRLQREVAIKVIPARVADDRERLARFEREARALAALNHPAIALIYGLEGGGSGDRPAMLVMELVDGEDLADRIARGPLPAVEALGISRQIADALDAAHTAGIVHRDLKPANIKLRPDGTVKLLDFGLAKIHDAAGDAVSAVTAAPPAMTTGGVILGTAAYMSPEQARGRPTDKRTDIWAFGCVLYEMLTGRPAFDGETMTDVLSSVVTSDPDWERLPADVPSRARRLLRRCLEKDPGRRLRDIGDAALELDDVESASASVAARPMVNRGSRTLGWVTVTLLVALVAAAAGYYSRRTPESRLLKTQVPIRPDVTFILDPVISPDGRQIAYIGKSRLWVQGLDEWEPRQLEGTEGAVRPFWSPDSQWIGYFRSEMILKVPAGGGPVVRVSAIPAVQATFRSNSGVWSEDGTIVASLGSGPLLAVPATGGDARPLAAAAEGTIDFHDVDWLPRGGLLATAHRAKGLDAIAIITNGTPRIVLEASEVRQPAYSPTGHLIYERRTPKAGIWAVTFSLAQLAVTGEPFLISEGMEPSISRDGTLSFVRETTYPPRMLAWFGLDGTVGARIAEPRDWTEGVAIARDSRRVIATTDEGLWLYDAETGVRSRVTSATGDIMPAWVDDNRVLFVRSEQGEPVLFLKELRSNRETALLRGARFPRTTADGKRVVVNLRTDERSSWQIAWIDLDQPQQVHRLAGAHVGARFPSISPDGRLVAYVSGEIGRDEIFLTDLPNGEVKFQVSNAGGGWTLFSPRGDELLYRSIDNDLMSVAISRVGEALKIGQPRKLFTWDSGWAPYYDLAPDGKRGVTAVPVERSQRAPSVSIVHNWHREFAIR